MTSREAFPKHSVLVSAHLRVFVFFQRDGRAIQDQSCPQVSQRKELLPSGGDWPSQEIRQEIPQPSYLPSLRLSHSAQWAWDGQAALVQKAGSSLSRAMTKQTFIPASDKGL